MDYSEKIWDYLERLIGNKFGVGGFMGNLESESRLDPCNIEDSYMQRMHMTDQEYIESVDNGTYTNFVRDAIGTGLAQWTYYTRKQALLDYAKSKNKSIGDLDMQLDFLAQELKTKYKGVLDVLKTASSVREASDCVLKDFENPKDQSEPVKAYRASLGEKWYGKYANKSTEPIHKKDVGKVTLYRVTTPKGLNIRKGPDTSFERIGCLTYKTIVGVNKKEANWGYVPAKGGWICLDYTECV